MLAHGDKFSLLPNNECEYEIRIIRVEPDENILAGTSAASPQAEPATSTSELRIRNAMEINTNLEAGNMATSLSQILGTSRSNGNEVDLDRTPSPEFLDAPLMQQPVVSTSPQSSANHAQSSPSRASRKRSIEESSDDDAPKKPRSSSPPLNFQPIAEENPDGISSSTSATAKELPGPAKDSAAAPSVKVKPDPDSSSSTSAAAGPSVGAIKPDPDAATSTSAQVKVEGSKAPANPQNANQPNQKPAGRASCDFGIRCYRSTPEHRAEFAHPANADYRRPDYPPAPADAPQCSFGAACYRRNPEHFRDNQHPPSSESILEIFVNTDWNSFCNFRCLHNATCCCRSHLRRA